MITFKKQEWPEIGDFVICSIENVTDYGAYVKLDEYDKKGLLHISEISSSWIKNIRNYVREGQKVVLKVLRVNEKKEQVDLSLRRVTRRNRRDKMMFWKQERKAETLLRSVAEKIGLPIEEVYEKAGALIEKEYGLYEGLEKTVQEGLGVLTKIGVPEDLALALYDIVKERIHVPMVKVKGIIELRCSEPDGVKIIQSAFLNALTAEKSKNVKFRTYVIAAPKYSIEVSAENYKHAEVVFNRVSENVVTNIIKAGGEGFYKREK